MTQPEKNKPRERKKKRYSERMPENGYTPGVYTDVGGPIHHEISCFLQKLRGAE